jgi:hypothetical protein
VNQIRSAHDEALRSDWRHSARGAGSHARCFSRFTDFRSARQCGQLPSGIGGLPSGRRIAKPTRSCPYVAAGLLSANLLKNGTLKTYRDFPHGMPTTEADTWQAFSKPVVPTRPDQA